MLLSNKLTLCLTFFIVLTFAALPVMAHEGADENSHTATGTDGALLNPPQADHVADDHPDVSLEAKPDHDDDAETPNTAITIVGGPDDGKTYIKANVASTRLEPAVAAEPTVTLRIVFSEDVRYNAPTAAFTELIDGVSLAGKLTVKIGVEGTNELLYYGVASGGGFGSLPAAISSVVFNPVDTRTDTTTGTAINSKSMFDVVFTLDTGALPVIEEDASAADADDAIAGRNILFEVVVEGGSAQALPDFQAANPLARWNNMPSDPTLFCLVPELPSQYVPDPTNAAPTVSVTPSGPPATPIPAADVADAEVTFTITVADDDVGGDATDGTINFNEVTVANGTVKDFATSGLTTTVVVTPAGAGVVKLTVAAGAITDAGGLESAEASGMHEIFVVDNEPPVLAVIPPTAPESVDDPATDRNEVGLLKFTITSNEPLFDRVSNPSLSEDIPALTISDIDIDTGEAYPLADGDLTKDATPYGNSAESYTLCVRPRAANTSVRVEVRANAAEDHAGNFTPGAEGQYDPEGGKPTVSITPRNLFDDTLCPAPAIPGQIDSLDGGEITIRAMDNVGLASGASIAQDEVTVNRGSIVAGSFSAGMPATFSITPDLNATTVEVVVKADAVRDAAGNGNAEKKMTFSVGPIFEIPADTILVIHKSPGVTYDYLSDQPRLPINQQPPTPAPNIQTDIWCNMPDLEVLFSFAGGSNGGTLNLTEAHGQTDPAELPQSRDGGEQQKNSVRISEVMWASDLALRGGINDEEAAEQWIEISNDTGKTVRVFLFARTGLDSARNVDNVEDRVGNAYNGSPGSAGWTVKGQNGNSYTGGAAGNFVSMHRKYVTDKNRGYVNGTSEGNWSASDRRYLASTAVDLNGELLLMRPFTPLAPFDFVGSPGRPHAINLPKPSTKAGRTAIPGAAVGENEKVVINEVANRSDERYEWIELRNDGSQVTDLRNFRISMVTAVGTETELFRFRHNDPARIPVGGVLLLVATDPRYDDDHPIAVGYNVDEPDADQVAGLGLQVDGSPRAPARYKVVNIFGSSGLPDDGKFVLIVRSPDNLENKNEGGKGWAELGETDLDKITDIAGWTDVSLKKTNYPGTNPAGLNNTDLWPLVNFGAPNVDGRNRLEVNRVHYRQHVNTNDGRRGTGITHNDKKVEQIAWRDAGYTGIGYKRTARQLTQHNGTPGYHGNTVNTKAASTVTISEVMYSTGANGTLPQWIELYNSSATKAVHLGSGWRIRIETLDSSGNALSNLLTINFGNKGSVKYIYPQQTALVAAGNARQAGSDFQPASVVFPETRLFNVSREYSGDGALKSDGFANDRYMFFNPKAFHLALLDKDGALVDEVGNLDGDSRTNDTVTPDEEFPSAVGENGRRSSIIRIYDDGTARAGMGGIMPMFKEGGNRNDTDGIDPKYSWIPAVNTGTEFKITIKSTWYGDEDDYGTPGHRAGLVLPVQLSSFRPTLEDGVVTVRWTTESELDNAGFNIYRSETRDGAYKQVNTELIEGAGTTGERTNYSWVDQTAKPGVVYYYQIEDVSFAGDREALAITKLKGLISAKNKLTTTWSELKEASQ